MNENLLGAAASGGASSGGGGGGGVGGGGKQQLRYIAVVRQLATFDCARISCVHPVFAVFSCGNPMSGMASTSQMPKKRGWAGAIGPQPNASTGYIIPFNSCIPQTRSRSARWY